MKKIPSSCLGLGTEVAVQMPAKSPQQLRRSQNLLEKLLLDSK